MDQPADENSSCVLLFLGLDNTYKGPGPKSTHARERDAEANTNGDSESNHESEKSIQQPEPAHHTPLRTDEVPQVPPVTEQSLTAEEQR